MNVRELIAKLQAINPEARVVMPVEVTYSEYTWAIENREVRDLIVWPTDDPEQATGVELVPEDN